MLFLSIVTLITFYTAGFFSLPAATAQGLFGIPFGLSQYGLSGNIQALTTPRYLYDFVSPLINQLGAANYAGTANYLRTGNYWGAGNGLQPAASIAGNLLSAAPLRTAHATVNGATTVFIPPSSTNLKVTIKPGQGIQSIKLSALTAPLTVYIYPSGYIPPAPATTTPATSTAPAVISGLGGLQQVFPSPYRSAYSLGQTFIPPWTTPSFVPFLAL